jgi:hypothetical protein
MAATDVLKPGTVVEVCGYLPKEPVVADGQRDPAPACPTTAQRTDADADG